nr:hypothetical protein [Candidatus Sigynarchaeota archaeon]
FPFACIIVDNSTCSDNVIVGNRFDSYAGRVSNITDDGVDTHFLKITSPANGTSFIGYGVPYPGYYPATDGFEDVADGSLPASWTCTGTGAGYSAEVISEKPDLYEYFTHVKVLDCYTGEGTSPAVNVTRAFAENVSSGTLEFWVLKSGATAGKANFTIGGAAGTLFTIMLDNGLFKFQNGSSINSTGIPFNNTNWYRLSIDFSDDGSYAELAAHQYRLKIYDSTGDGLLCPPKVANYTANGNCTSFHINVIGGPSSNLSIFIDAVGYSWVAGYSVGDNALEGILLSQKSQPGYLSATSTAYSLNEGNVTLLPSLGTVVIPLPTSLGTHALRLYGNDTFGNQTRSAIVQFTCWFDRQLFVESFIENEQSIIENYQAVGDGFSNLSPSVDLNITIGCYAEKDHGSTTINTTIFFRINGGSWQAPLPVSTTLGPTTITFIVPESNYVLGDIIDYYISIKQMDLSMNFLQHYYWTKVGVKYFESEARCHPFHKRISPIPYQLVLNYSAFYQAENEITLPNDHGTNTTLVDYMPVTSCNFS